MRAAVMVAGSAAGAVRAHPRHLILFALVAGLLSARIPVPATLALAVMAAAAGGRSMVGVLAALAVMGGAGLAQERLAQSSHGALEGMTGRVLTGRAVVLEAAHPRLHGGATARVRWLAGPARGDVALARLPAGTGRAAQASTAAPRSDRPEVGTVLALRGRIAPLAPWEAFQRRRGAHAAIEVSSVAVTNERRGGLAGALDAVRDRARRGLRRGLPLDEAAVLRGMVLGEDSAIGDDVRGEFERSGLAHLLAVSGQNVMLLAALVLAAGAVVGAPLRLRLAAALGLVLLYVPLAGGGPSIQRAGVMGAAGLVAALAGRPASRWYALGLAAAATLTVNPAVVAEPGGQLPFAAVIALLAGAAPLGEALRRRHIPRAAAEVLAITTLATVATAPLLAHHFGELSLVSLPANLLAAPAVAPLMWLGMLAAAAAQVDMSLAEPLTMVNGRLVAYVEWVAHTAARAPSATAAVRLSWPWGVVIAYLVIAAGGLGAAAAVVRRRRRADSAGGSAPAVPRSAVMRRPAVAMVIVMIALGLAAGVAWRLRADWDGAAPLGDDEVLVSFLDVGQGDATLLQAGSASLLVDTGPPDGPVLRRLAEAVVRQLDALLITHAQADHEGAALAVVGKLKPRLVLNGGSGWPTSVQQGLPLAARAAGSRIVAAHAGQDVRLGALELRLLWPPPSPSATAPGGDPNERAVVARVSRGSFDLLMPADAESDVLSGLELAPVEALKVSHHGSDDAGLPALLERLHPSVAAIEVGRGNSYGHPTPGTLSDLGVVAQVVRTDRDGTVRLHVRNGAMSLERHADGGGGEGLAARLMSVVSSPGRLRHG